MSDQLFKNSLLDLIVESDSDRFSGGVFSDVYQNVYNPSENQLIKFYKRTQYTCANLNSNAVACKPLKLFVTTTSEQQESILPRTAVDEKRQSYLKSQFKLKDNVQIEEVTEHPLLNLFANPFFNSIYLNQFKLFHLTQVYQEIVGVAYWWLIRHPILQIPIGLWIIPPQDLRPVKETGSKKPIDYYEYTGSDEQFREKRFSVDEIIPFLNPSLFDPYKIPTSPNEASYDVTLILEKLASHINGMLDKRARPDLLISPKEAMSRDMAERWELQLNARYSLGRSGGIHVIEDPVNVEELSFGPQEIAHLDLADKGLQEICNTYQVPVALLKSESINKMTLEAAMHQHALYGVLPRLQRNADTLTTVLIPRYDTSGRLFVGFDDPVPENKEIKLQENVQLVMNGIKTRNEARKEYQLPPHPDGDELVAINTPGNSGDYKREDQRNSGEAEK